MSHDGIQKAAVFLSGLDVKTADILLAKLEPTAATAVRIAMKSLGTVAMPDVLQSAEEFLATSRRHAAALTPPQTASSSTSGTLSISGGVYSRPCGTSIKEMPRTQGNSGNTRRDSTGHEKYTGLARNVDQDVFEMTYQELPTNRELPPAEGSTVLHFAVSGDSSHSPTTTNTAVVPEDTEKERLFTFLHQRYPNEVASALVAERPQTIALVMSHLPHQQAGELLAAFPPAIQAEIAHRFVNLEETDETTLRDVEAVLRERLTPQWMPERKRVAGVTAMEKILAACRPETAVEILQNLESHDHELADKIEYTRLKFDDLAHFSDTEWLAVFRQVDRKTVLQSLFGAPQSVIDRLLRSLDTEKEARFREEIMSLGPVSSHLAATSRRTVLRAAAVSRRR